MREAQISLHETFWKNDLQAGVYGFGQHQYNYFNNVFTDGTPNVPASSISVNGGVVSEFVNDKFKVTPWFTLITGFRATQFKSTISETAADPRFGAALRIPRLNWVFTGFYGYYYQAPPLVTATGPLLDLANGQNVAFAPLLGERDIQWQYGVAIPYRNWTLNINNYETRAENWLDHSNIGESNIFWPITWSYALIQGWSATLRSPDVFHHGQFHLAYANQIAQATSPITGGLVCPAPVTSACPLDIPPGLSPVDHDQRNTLNVGFDGIFPHRIHRVDECLLRLRIYQRPVWNAAGTISRRVSAWPHHLRPLRRKIVWDPIHRLGERAECGESSACSWITA